MTIRAMDMLGYAGSEVRKFAFRLTVKSALLFSVIFALGIVLMVVFVPSALLILVPMTFLFPGYVLSSTLFKNIGTHEKFVLGPALMTPVLALLSLANYILGSTGRIFILISEIFIIFVSTYLFLRRRLCQDVAAFDKFGLYSTLALFVFAWFYVTLPAPIGSIPFLFAQPWHTRVPFLPGDQVLPFRVAQFVLNQADLETVEFYCCGWLISDRPPLMGLLAAFFLATAQIKVSLAPIWGMSAEQVALSGYPEFQMVGIWLDSLLVLSGYLLIKRIIHRRVAQIVTSILLMNPFILWNTFYTSPKSMGAYFVFLFFILLIEGKHLKLAGLMAALAYLSHQYVLVYIIGGLVFWLLKHGLTTINVRRIFVISIVMIAAVAPWELWTILVYGHPSKFLLYPLAVSGFNPENPQATLQDFARMEVSSFIWTKVLNLYRTIFPFTLGFTLSDINQLFAGSNIASTISMYPYIAALAFLYIFSLPGALTLTMTLPSYLGSLNKAFRLELFSFVAIPLALSVMMIGYPTSGVTPYFLQPTIPLLLASGVALLLRADLRYARLLFLGLFIESFFMTWVITYPAILLYTEVHSATEFAVAVVAASLYIGLLVNAYKSMRSSQTGEIWPVLLLSRILENRKHCSASTI